MTKENMETAENKQAQLGSQPITSLMVRMAVPGIIAQLINILYSIIDRIYIGHIPGVGANALTGVGLTFPIITLVSAFAMIVGAGGAPLAAIALGKKDRDEAEKILGTGVFLLIGFALGIMAVFYIWKRPFLRMFGASDATIGYADTYISIYLIGTTFVLLYMGLNQYIIAQGKSVTAMLSVGIGAVLNLVLDPLFIFVFHLDVGGAAIATVISQTASALWVVWTLTNKNASLTLRACLIRPHKQEMKDILALGVSPFIMSSTESLISIVINRGLSIYGGDLYVGSFTIIQSIMQMIAAPVQGFTQGVQPIISYNYGAGDYDRVRGTYRRMIGVTFAFVSLATLCTILFPTVFAGMFTNERPLIELVGEVMPVFMLGMLVFGLQNGIQPTFVALGQAKISLFIAVLRKIILLIPLAIILPYRFGVMGVYYAEPISDALSAATATTLFLLNINRILKKSTND
ncbi:MAG: MATE family efflux transporter [Lachnospiraceae bacterium]|nr:MATE family efflux transporter [bacterium]MDY5517384.1 MATE family efflux transporter [Lachnospiraceae bacterium]